MTPIHRFLIPGSLVIVGVWLLVGCIYVPTFNVTVSGKDATKSVGATGSGKKLQPGRGTRENVQQVLGKPYFATSDGRFWVYSWERRKGIQVWPLCFTGGPEDDSFAMTLEFGADGVMRDFELEQGLKRGYLFSVADADQFVPTRVMIHQRELDLEKHHPELLEEFRAATRGARRPPATRSVR